MTRLTIKNWKDFQHYKDRAPPWIKLHKKLLDDFEYQRLPIASRALAPMLWLLASESEDGSFDGDIEKLSFRLRQPAKDVQMGLEPLIDAGFVLPVHPNASGMLATGLQHATPERETERERETETETEAEKKTRGKPASIERPPEVPEVVWRDFLQVRKAKKAPLTETALKGIEREAHAAGISLTTALRECCARGWQGFKAEWYRKNGGQANQSIHEQRAEKVRFLTGREGGDDDRRIIDIN